MEDVIFNEYVNWLFNLVYTDKPQKQLSYKKLLTHLSNTKFRYVIPNDANRAEDGADLRYHFALERNYDPDMTLAILAGPCSMLEMMVGLAIRCEDTVEDPKLGNRTGQWFWGMVSSLGLGSMTDDRFDEYYVEKTINIFLDREYEPDGRGGLFTIYNCEYDLRTFEIWRQLCWYLDSFT